MIPDFDGNGNLPTGIHTATVDEVVQRFGVKKSLRRRDLTANLTGFISSLQPFAVGLYIDGSYTTGKLSPRDIDLVVVLPPEFDWNSSEGSRLRGYQLDHKRNHLHIFAHRLEFENEALQHRIEWFIRDRSHNEKGILYIEVRT